MIPPPSPAVAPCQHPETDEYTFSVQFLSFSSPLNPLQIVFTQLLHTPYQNCCFQALQQSPNVNPHSLSYLTYQTLTMVEHYFILETLPSQDTTSSHMLLLSLLTGPPNLPTFSCWSAPRLTYLELLFASYYLSIHIYIVLS